MASMTSRERVLAALEHREPDRVPTALGGGPYGLVDDLYFKLLDVLDLGEPVPPFRTGHNISYMDDRVLERLGVDTRYVWPGASPSSPQRPGPEPETFLDGFGQVWRRAVPYYYPDHGLLSKATTIDEIEALVTWPDPNDPAWTAGVAERARLLRENTNCFIVARMVTSYGVFQTACNLRGMAEFMMDMVLNPPLAHHLVSRITDTIAALLSGYLQAAGDNIDMIELPGDDYAANENLLISPELFRDFIKPALRRLVHTIREHNPAIKIMAHSDGMIAKLVPEYIDLGIDVLHPLEPVPALDQAAIKAEYGDRLAFLGGIDISHAMRGSREDVIAEARRCITALAPGGGYILAPSNHLQADVPPENVITLFEAARQFGQYPLR
ncbi:MAG: uroporphyrinogen decarboxylase family protein [Anaerolineae bacterium]